MLEGVGVTPEQERTYRVLVDHPGAEAAELVTRTGLDEHRLADVLAGLESLGLVSATASNPRTYIPAPPQLAIEALIAMRQDGLERARLEGAQLMKRYRDTPTRLSSAAMVEVIRSRQAARQRYDQLKRNVQHELVALDKAPYVVPYDEDLDELRMLEQGISVRGIYERSVLDDPGHLRHIQTMQQHGEVSRVLPSLPMKIMIADRSVALLPLTTGDGGDHQTWALIHPSELLDGLIAMFDALYRRAVPLRLAARTGSSDTNISDQDRELLALMLAGLQDQAAARQMGVTSRTVARRVARLMDAAEADTRFQLGWQAAQRDWV